MPSEMLSSKSKTWAPSSRELRALHHVLIRARFEAYQESLSRKEIGAVLDDAEYLVSLLMSDQADAPGMFRSTLQHLETRYPVFNGTVARYDQEQEEGTDSIPFMTTPKTLK